MLNQNRDIIEKLIRNLMNESEKNAIIMTKIIQDIMLHDFKEKSKFSGGQAILHSCFDQFYGILEKKAEQFSMINDEEYQKKNFIVTPDAKDNLTKVIKMEHSV